MFRVKCSNLNDKTYSYILFDVSEHRLFQGTNDGVCHLLGCNFSGIFNELYSILESDEFKEEQLSSDNEDVCYEFTYRYNGKEKSYKGSIKGTKYHAKMIDIINSCAKECLDDQVRLTQNNWGKLPNGETAQWVLDIKNKRQNLYENLLANAFKNYLQDFVLS